jgi:hypothetical protein
MLSSCRHASAAFLVAVSAVLPLHATPDQDYLLVYTALNDSESLERAGDFDKALVGFEDCYNRLWDLHVAHPRWEEVLVTSRLQDCRAKIVELTHKDSNASESSILHYPLHPAPPPSTTNYPWKNNILSTVFWIGEDKQPSSSWDPHWIADNGGADHQFEMSGYASDEHASTTNPFYVALPFNDLAHPDLAAKWLPAGWRPTEPGGPVCKDRWVEIKGRSGRCCFAQWEDVGPVDGNDAAYVFGPAKPKTERGLNVSPAVAKYLGFESASMVSWRFVDDADVTPGMWLRYDEQALLFRAILEAKKK